MDAAKKFNKKPRNLQLQTDCFKKSIIVNDEKYDKRKVLNHAVNLLREKYKKKIEF